MGSGSSSPAASETDFGRVAEICTAQSTGDTRVAFLGVTGVGKSSLISLLYKACQLDSPVTNPSPTIKQYTLTKGTKTVNLVDAAGFTKDDMVQATSRQFYVNLMHGCYGWDVFGIPPSPSASIRSYKDRVHVCVFMFSGKDEWLTSKKVITAEQGAAGIRWYPIARAARNLHLGSIAVITFKDNSPMKNPETVLLARTRISELLRLNIDDVFAINTSTERLGGKISVEQAEVCGQLLYHINKKGEEAFVRLKLEAEGKPVPTDEDLQKRSFDMSARPSLDRSAVTIPS